MFLHLDCRHYLGDRPCRFERECEGCPHYSPMGPRVLIIKIGALGDVVRTACILPSLTQLTGGEPPHVTWLTAPAAMDIVRRLPGVDRVWPLDAETLLRLSGERFDLVISLDKEPVPCAAAMAARADRKLGVGLSRYGTPYPLNDEAEYYFSLGLDNEAKFHRNRLTYPALVHEALGLEYAGTPYRMELTAADRAWADSRLAALPGTQPARWLGINPGAGKVFAYKAWREAGYVELIREAAKRRPDLGFLLLGGRDETELIGRIQAASPGLPVFSPGTDNPLGGFAALIERCDVLVSGDTLAMHLAVALGRRSVAVFGPTCEQEIDLYGRGVKIKTPIECSPCYRRSCDKSPTCQDLIPAALVLEAALDQLDKARSEAAEGEGEPVPVT